MLLLSFIEVTIDFEIFSESRAERFLVEAFAPCEKSLREFKKTEVLFESRFNRQASASSSLVIKREVRSDCIALTLVTKLPNS